MLPAIAAGFFMPVGEARTRAEHKHEEESTMKKLLAILVALILALSCFAAIAEEEDEENYETGDATLDLVRNEDESGDKELLVVSFGTSFNDSRRLTIGAIEKAMAKAFQIGRAHV